MCLREKIGPDPRNFNQRVSLGRHDLLIRTFLNFILLFSFLACGVGQSRLSFTWMVTGSPASKQV